MSIIGAPVSVFLGGGGVGKTTLAACAGIAAAQAGQRVVVLTIDPARRLATTLGLDATVGEEEETSTDGEARNLGNEPRLIDGPWPGELWAAMLDPTATMWTVLCEQTSPERAARITANPLFATVVESLSGSNEYLAAERLLQLHDDDRFDAIVLDTPPSRHAIDFLESPDRLARFLGNRLYRLVLAPRPGLLRPVNSAAQLIMRTAARLVGSDLIDNVIRLFADTEGLDDALTARATRTSALLADDGCRFTVVSTPREEPMREAQWIIDRLHERDRRADALVVNRCLPFGRGPVPDGADTTDQALLANWQELAHLAALEDDAIDKLRGQAPDRLSVATLDERLTPLRSIEELATLAAELAEAVDTV
ncbi:MAG: ArsA-related P-loop ATPase [Actinomycetota bacterium]